MANSVVRGEKSLGELFRELSEDTSTLIRQEVALATRELSDRVRAFGRDAVLIIVGGVLALAALMTWVAAGVLGLVTAGMAPWAAAVLIAALLSIVALVLVVTRLSAMRRRGLTPVETVASMRETATWLRNETH